MALLGRNYTDAEARETGLAHEVLPGDGLESAALARLEELSGRGDELPARSLLLRGADELKPEAERLKRELDALAARLQNVEQTMRSLRQPGL